MLEELVRNRITGLAVLHPSIEEYINYDRLGSGSDVYAASDRHRPRSAAFAKALRGLSAKVHQYGLQLFVKPYEYSYPDELARGYNVLDVEVTCRQDGLSLFKNQTVANMPDVR